MLVSVGWCLVLVSLVWVGGFAGAFVVVAFVVVFVVGGVVVGAGGAVVTMGAVDVRGGPFWCWPCSCWRFYS